MNWMSLSPKPDISCMYTTTVTVMIGSVYPTTSCLHQFEWCWQIIINGKRNGKCVMYSPVLHVKCSKYAKLEEYPGIIRSTSGWISGWEQFVFHTVCLISCLSLFSFLVLFVSEQGSSPSAAIMLVYSILFDGSCSTRHPVSSPDFLSVSDGMHSRASITWAVFDFDHDNLFLAAAFLLSRFYKYTKERLSKIPRLSVSPIDKASKLLHMPTDLLQKNFTL